MICITNTVFQVKYVLYKLRVLTIKNIFAHLLLHFIANCDA